AQWQHRLRAAVARLLRRAARAVTLDDEDLGAYGAAVGAIGKFSRQPQLAHRALAGDFLLLAAPNAFLGALDHEFQKLVGLRRIAREPMIERILDCVLEDALR